MPEIYLVPGHRGWVWDRLHQSDSPGWIIFGSGDSPHQPRQRSDDDEPRIPLWDPRRDPTGTRYAICAGLQCGKTAARELSQALLRRVSEAPTALAISKGSAGWEIRRLD